MSEWLSSQSVAPQEGSALPASFNDPKDACRVEDVPLPEEICDSGEKEAATEIEAPSKNVNDVFDEILKKEVVAVWGDSSSKQEVTKVENAQESDLAGKENSSGTAATHEEQDVGETSEEIADERTNPDDILQKLETLLATVKDDIEKDKQTDNEEHSAEVQNDDGPVDEGSEIPPEEHPQGMEIQEVVNDVHKSPEKEESAESKITHKESIPDEMDLDDLEISPKETPMEIDDDEFADELMALREEEKQSIQESDTEMEEDIPEPQLLSQDLPEDEKIEEKDPEEVSELNKHEDLVTDECSPQEMELPPEEDNDESSTEAATESVVKEVPEALAVDEEDAKILDIPQESPEEILKDKETFTDLPEVVADTSEKQSPQKEEDPGHTKMLDEDFEELPVNKDAEKECLESLEVPESPEDAEKLLENQGEFSGQKESNKNVEEEASKDTEDEDNLRKSLQIPETAEMVECSPQETELPPEEENDVIESSTAAATDNLAKDAPKILSVDEKNAKIDDIPQENPTETLKDEETFTEVKQIDESQHAVENKETEDKKEEMEEELKQKTPPEDDDVVLIEEDEPTESETIQEIPKGDKEQTEKVSLEKDTQESKEKSLDIKLPEEQKEAAESDIIEIPEDEPSQETSAVKECKDAELSEAESTKNEAPKAPSVTDDNSSMSMDLMNSNDVPSERADPVEDNLTPMDLEVDETANAEWAVKHFNTTAPQEQPKDTTEKYKHYDCINVECKSQSGVEFAPAQGFIVSFYSTKKRKKTQYVCEPCYCVAMEKMMGYCNILTMQKPLFHHFPQHADVVEITDSSEDSSPEEEMVQNMRKPLKEADRDLIEKNLDQVIIDTMKRVNINQQFDWTKKDLEKRFNKLERSHQEVNNEFQKIQKMVDNVFKNLSSREKRTTQNEPPIHIFTEFPPPDDPHAAVNSRIVKERVSVSMTTPGHYTPPAHAAAPKSPIYGTPAIALEVKIGTIYYGMRSSLTKPWSHCEVLDKLTGNGDTKYRVKFLRQNQDGILSGKQLAFAEPPTQKLSVGCRVVAQFSAARRKLFYPGIVAEPTQETNKFRYLIFFDDGYVQYVFPNDIRRIICVSENVWDDVHPSSRDFIRNYLQENQYQRAVAQVKIGQKIEVERDGKWVSMRVAKVDCSLILVYFAEYTEWIYSGSQRLLPIYRMKMDSRLSTGKKLQTRNEPYVSFRNVVDDSQKETENRMKEAEESRGNIRSVAKKSTQTIPPTPPVPSQPKQLMNNSTIFLEDDNYPKGKVVFYTAKFNMPPKSYTPHECNTECLYRISYDLNLYNPLAKPLLSGWERKIYRVKTRRYVIYKAPCGRSLRNIDEVHRYLRVTECALNVDNYDFDPAVHCLAEYVIDSAIVRKSDISNGVETMPIGCVNCYDETVPPPCKYANHRIPTEGVHLNLDPEFLVGCDCTDDCMDKSKCSCWQTTIAGVRTLQPNIDINTVGYTYKKLYDPVPTGIYECNSRCKCSASCLNRVVQHPLSLKLQVFKTANRGWGLRCLNDVPKGQFICIYAGHLLTEQKANEGGQNHGDEYFAELDYIEVAENIKEGYEPEAHEEDSNSDRDDDEYNPDKRRGSDSDDDYFTPHASVTQKTIKTRSRTRGSSAHENKAEKPKSNKEGVISISDDEDERIPQSFVPNISIEKELMPTNKTRSLRRMFGKREDVYVMDAKIMGNVGRYFNHSCAPNLFVQNVFVDTHDLRFPWVSFFAMSHIRAGTELTWNYNYDVGTVPGKFLFCQCGSRTCRGRIL